MKKTLSLTALATGLAVSVVAGAAPAQAAEPVTGGSPSTGENVVRGAGSGTADAEVSGATGAMSLSSTATGGQNALTPLGIAFLGGPTSSGATGSLAQSLGEVGPGTYRVRVTFADTAVESLTRGNGSTNEQTAVFAGFQCHQGCESREDHSHHAHVAPAGRFDELPDAGGTVTRTVAVVVPEGESGTLFANVSVTAGSFAHKRGNSAVSEVEVGSISTVVER